MFKYSSHQIQHLGLNYFLEFSGNMMQFVKYFLKLSSHPMRYLIYFLIASELMTNVDPKGQFNTMNAKNDK